MDITQYVSLFGLTLDDNNIVKIGKNYYHANEDLKKIRGTINRDVFSLGIYLGCDSGKHFDPSPALIDMLSKMSGVRKIFIDKKVEQLFLYGRNILGESIIKNPDNLTSGYVFVQNDQDENLGYGIFNQQGDRLVIKNLLDKGYYLRKEAKKRK